MPKIAIIIIITIIILAGLGCGAYWYFYQRKPVVCVQDSKQCLDGSYVGHIPPRCEFASCPEAKDQTTDWQTYRNGELGISFKYPKEWGETQYEDNYKNLDVENAKNFGFPMNVIRFSASNIQTPVFGIIPVKFIPGGIYVENYEGMLFLKVDLKKEKQYLERAKIGDKCFQAEYDILASQDSFSCQIVSLNKGNTIKAQLSYAYFLPSASVGMTYNFYAGDFKFSVSDNFSALDKLSVDARNVIIHDEKIINNFIESLKNKTANPDIVKRLNDFNLMISTFKFIE